MVKAVIEKFGKVDILVNNAGSGVVGSVESNQFVEGARRGTVLSSTCLPW